MIGLVYWEFSLDQMFQTNLKAFSFEYMYVWISTLGYIQIGYTL